MTPIEFVQAFIDAFEPCDVCGGSGKQIYADGTEDACQFCDGIGRQTVTWGGLIVDLYQEAEDILAKEEA